MTRAGRCSGWVKPQRPGVSSAGANRLVVIKGRVSLFESLFSPGIYYQRAKRLFIIPRKTRMKTLFVICAKCVPPSQIKRNELVGRCDAAKGVHALFVQSVFICVNRGQTEIVTATNQHRDGNYNHPQQWNRDRPE